MADTIDLEARLSALEMIVVTHILQSGIGLSGFDPRSFAASRRDAWSAVGKAVCDGCSTEDEEKRFARAYANALERIGHMLVALAEPVQEAVDEVFHMPDASQKERGNSLQDASAEAVEALEERERSGASTAGAGDIG